MKKHDLILDFPGFSNVVESSCYIKIFENCGKIIVIVSNNKGTSVTNSAEKLAYYVSKEFEIPSSKLIWIEYYPKERRPFGESFDIVEFRHKGDSFNDPTWNETKREKVEELIGEKF